MEKILSATVYGLNARVVETEVDVASGLPGFSIVGLGDKAVSESKERVRAAIKHSHFSFPQKKITVNLSPADLKKEGSGFDLAIAVAVLKASGQFKENAKHFFFGELSLSGELRSVRGIVPIIHSLAQTHPDAVFVIPASQLGAAELVRGAKILPIETLAELIQYFLGERELKMYQGRGVGSELRKPEVDFSEIVGQLQAKRALEIAAVGGHHLLFSGPPGGGKTLLAKAFPGILPAPSQEELVEINSIYSAAGLLTESKPIVSYRPFRSPHHTSSAISLVGGGQDLRPGEVTLAHRGVLFLDELPEFQRIALEALREPLEDRKITIARAKGAQVYPASFQLLASQNPCRCGNYGSRKKLCVCSPGELSSYRRRVSAAILDRIDLRLQVAEYEGGVTFDNSAESSQEVRNRVGRAREFVSARGQKRLNGELSFRELKKFCALDTDSTRLVELARDKFGLSLRSIHKVIRTARSIADLSGTSSISTAHVSEALQYRLATEKQPEYV